MIESSDPYCLIRFNIIISDHDILTVHQTRKDTHEDIVVVMVMRFDFLKIVLRMWQVVNGGVGAIKMGVGIPSPQTIKAWFCPSVSHLHYQILN